MVNMDKMDKEILKRELRKDKHHSRQWFDYGSETARQWLDLDGRFLAQVKSFERRKQRTLEKIGRQNRDKWDKDSPKCSQKKAIFEIV